MYNAEHYALHYTYIFRKEEMKNSWKFIHENEGTFARISRKCEFLPWWSLFSKENNTIQCRRGWRHVETDIQTREYHSYTFIDRDINLIKASLVCSKSSKRPDYHAAI